MIKFLLGLFNKAPERNQEDKFDPRVRINSENMTDIEKMDVGFNGKTYTNNGIESDF
jgi:hypothetical protein